MKNNMLFSGKYKYWGELNGCKTKNTKKKMALLDLKKDKDGDYRYIDPDDTTSEFVPVRNRNKNKENK
mgnify:FL=1